MVASPELADQRHGLGQAVVPLRVLRERARGSLFVQRFARADTQEHPTRLQHTQRRKCLGDDDWIVAKGRCRHASAEEPALRLRAQQSEGDPREHAVALVLLPRLDVVAGPETIEAGPLGGRSELKELLGRELFVGEHERELILAAADRLGSWSGGRSQSRRGEAADRQADACGGSTG